jgi:hypothetical protein
VSLDFLDNVFERIETEEHNPDRKRFMGEWFRVSYISPNKNVVAFTPDSMEGCHWWELYLQFEDMFSTDYDDNIVVDVDYSDATGTVFLKFYMYSEN